MAAVLAASLGRARAAVQAAPAEVLGLVLQVLSVMCVAVMSLCAKLAQQAGVPVFEVVLARSAVLLAFSCGMLIGEAGGRTSGLAAPFHTRRKGTLLLRGLLGFGAVSTIYATAYLLPLADAAVLAFLSPIFVAALSPCLLGEPGSRGVAAAIPLAALGVVCVAQPTALFGGGGGGLNPWGVTLGVLQAVFSAAAKMTIRSLNSTEQVGSIVFSQSVISLAGSGLLCAVLPRHFTVPRSAKVWLTLAGVGVMGCGNQWLGTVALRLCSAAPAIAMSYVGVLWGLLFDLTLFHQPPDGLQLLGAALVCASSFLVVADRRKAAAAAGAAAAGAAGGRSGDGRGQYELVDTARAAVAAEEGEGGSMPASSSRRAPEGMSSTAAGRPQAVASEPARAGGASPLGASVRGRSRSPPRLPPDDRPRLPPPLAHAQAIA